MKRSFAIKLLQTRLKKLLLRPGSRHCDFQRTESWNCSRYGNKVIRNPFSIVSAEAVEPNKELEIKDE